MPCHLPGPRTGDRGLKTKEGLCQSSPQPHMGLLPGRQWGGGKGRWWAQGSWEMSSVPPFFQKFSANWPLK